VIADNFVDLYARDSSLRDKRIAERDVVLTYAARTSSPPYSEDARTPGDALLLASAWAQPRLHAGAFIADDAGCSTSEDSLGLE
jgi:hypothetical protein